MEISWKWLNLCLVIIFQFCQGFPVDLEDNAVEDNHTQLLTGLVAVLLTVCSLVFLAGCLCCQRRNGFKDEEKEFRDSPVVVSNFDHGHVNPVANGEFTIFTPLSLPHLNNNIFLANEQVARRTSEDWAYGDIDVSSWFSESEKEFPRTKLKYIKELGQGWFGKVVEGTALVSENNQQTWTPVVVKILEATATHKERVIFLHDASIYRCEPHPNLLSLIGRCLDTVPILLLQEYCQLGDLKGYLRANKASADKFLSTEYPLVWCCQLTSALKHLHSFNIVHQDVATRNCQLTSNMVLKLGDYGLAVAKYPDDYYEGAHGVPVRWCAPESLNCTSTTIQPKKSTAEGNVWSLGVTMWEICECGVQPYGGMTNDEVISQVLGPPCVRLARPSCNALYTDYIFRLMQLCWTNAESRPAVIQIDLMLNDLLQVHRNTKTNPAADKFLSAEDFDKQWESFKPNGIVKTDDVTTDTDHPEADIAKPPSPSLNNSLLEPQLEAWLENAKNSKAKDSFSLETTSSSDQDSPKVKNAEWKVNFDVNSKFSPITSSESETEDENWRNKVERGAYTEKVRLKSRSVTDLMVLTHVDYSESESETPLPSLDYRINYKNVRLPKSGLTFGSEGNLLSVQDEFQEELKKLQEDRRDSLTFVPDTNQTSVRIDNNLVRESVSETNFCGVDSPNKLMQELNSTSEIQPPSQVFNVFNVTIDKFSPLHVNRLVNINENLSQLKQGSDGDKTWEETRQRRQNVSSESNLIKNISDTSENANPTDGCERLTDKRGYMEKTKSCVNEKETRNGDVFLGTENKKNGQNCCEDVNEIEMLKQALDLTGLKVVESLDIGRTNMETFEDDPHVKQVPTLTDMIQNNDELMDYIIKFDTMMNPTDDSDSSDAQRRDSLSSDAPKNDNYEGNSESNTDAGECLEEKKLNVSFDLSSNQVGAMPNSLTHFNAFTSTPMGKRQELSLPNKDVYSSLNLFGSPEENQDENVEFSSNFAPFPDNDPIDYSLETWDNFLGKTFDDQNGLDDGGPLERFTSEPTSLLFVENEMDIKENDEVCEASDGGTFVVDNVDVQGRGTQENSAVAANETFKKIGEETFVLSAGKMGDKQNETCEINETYAVDQNSEGVEEAGWEAGGGWFLHPQSTNEDMYGEMEALPSSSTDSYVGFGVDNDIMDAIRNELLCKLPHAQAASSEKVREEDEWDSYETNEVFLKYNVYNPPLSPILEESYMEELSEPKIPRPETEMEGSEWSETCGPENLLADTESQSAHTYEGPHHRHTPSQDSCCSSDTLFNLEELICATTEADASLFKNRKDDDSVVEAINTEVILNLQSKPVDNNNDEDKITKEDDSLEIDNETVDCGCEESQLVNNDSKDSVENFLTRERGHIFKVTDFSEGCSSKTNSLVKTQAPPLPSPEDNPWKKLPASMLNFDKVTTNSTLFPAGQSKASSNVPEYANCIETKHESHYENESCKDCLIENALPIYENMENADIYNEADYVNIVNLENTRNSIEYEKSHEHDFANDLDPTNEGLSTGDDNIFGVLTDIRFNGPTDNQLMTTSFSESNDLNNEQDWDSGSDTRSSSSGEFIWKEGEHEESLKALRAAPQDVLEDIKPMGGILEESSDESEVSSSSCSDEERETPEFVPSAWDKFAMPAKSAMRSPEKTLQKSEQKKSKGVWFKKQKYHCVYEYPREPESPVLQSHDLWKLPTDYSSFTGNSSLGDEFFISSSTRPFDMIGGCSQFFPGNVNSAENATPDSGVEDITPSEFPNVCPSDSVLPLKTLASVAIDRNKQTVKSCNDSLGGLRHTRNKLKLDLPLSPSAFTSARTFSLEQKPEAVVREKPTFSTFGKGRFSVQHVDTPSDDSTSRNVSFEALPYKRLNESQSDDAAFNLSNTTTPSERVKLTDKIDTDSCKELVRGEASLLDSADEDSGIESSTLERKLSNAT